MSTFKKSGGKIDAGTADSKKRKVFSTEDTPKVESPAAASANKKSKKDFEQKPDKKIKKFESESEEEQEEKPKKDNKKADVKSNGKSKKIESESEEEEKPKSKKTDNKSNGKKKVEAEDEEEEVEKPTKKAAKPAENGKKAKKVEPEEEVKEEEPSKKSKKDNSSSKGFDGASSTGVSTADFRSQNEISVTGEDTANPFHPVQSFKDAAVIFSPNIMAATKKFQKPTPIQAQCWPILLKKRDIIAIAETGSGKTLAFGLPGLVHLEQTASNYNIKKGPAILVLSPTRELAMQTAVVFSESGVQANIKSTCIYGGVPKPPQQQEIRAGVHVIIATPGRLLDHMNDGTIKLSQVSMLILDEADRMLDMGFERDIRSILAEIPKNRQTLMFSATWPTSIQKLAAEFLTTPVRVTIGSEDLAANHRVSQFVEVVDPREKDAKLIDLLQKVHKSRKNRVLVFALYKLEASRIEETLTRKGWKCVAIHGDKSQQLRTAALEKFKSGETPLLIATDVAARGLDIPEVEYVINYTFPLTIEDYVHRIGRTGRAGRTGVSHTLFTLHDKSHAGELANVLREAGQTVPESLTNFGTAIKKKEHALYGNHFKDVDITKKSTHVKF